MGAVKVTAPVADYEGVVAGQTFTKGVASVDSASIGALSYFRNAGYTVDGDTKASADVQPPVDAREATTVLVGSPLRDAAVDPKPEDYLPPTNAGQADPHGPDVVSPEIHGSQGTRPVTPGVVADEPTVQEADETAATVEATDVDLEQPKRNGSQADWAAYAVSKGADPDEAAQASRDELVEQYGA